MTHSPSSTPPTGQHLVRPDYVPVVNGINHPRQLLASMQTTLVAVDITGFGTRHDPPRTSTSARGCMSISSRRSR